MKAVIAFFKGKKSYILGAAIGITAGLFAAGLIDEPTAQMLLTMMGGGAVLTLREAIGKSE